METEEKVNVKEKSSEQNALMRNTKTELINIILRKDDVEKKLRKENKALRDDCIGTTKSNKELRNKLNRLEAIKNEYEDNFEEKCDQIAEYININHNLILKTNKLQKQIEGKTITQIIMLIILIVSIIFHII